MLCGVAGEQYVPERADPPPFFLDLNLDQVVDAITLAKEEYDLRPILYHQLSDVHTIHYRQAVMRDLENPCLLEHVRAFAEGMIVVRRYLQLVDKLRFAHHQHGWFLEAVLAYCENVVSLVEALRRTDLRSRGFREFREYLGGYAEGSYFRSLAEEATRLKAALSSIRYTIGIKGFHVSVGKYNDEPDYSAEVEQTFAKFRQGAVKDYRSNLRAASGMNHVEAQILDCVAKLYPDIFSGLSSFDEYYRGRFVDGAIRTFDREIQFYVAYLEFIAPIKQAGLEFCYPEITTRKNIHSHQGFDIALAHKLVAENSTVVCNDFYLEGGERVLVISGPNQGGKTTFARAFGQLHYLATIGYPVPGSKARLFLHDRILTHFEREENIRNLRGKLQDDLVRIHRALEQSTPNSILIMNEIFSSTTLQDAILLGKNVMSRIQELDCFCVWVTFVDELASMSKTVSMVSTVNPENPVLRTYKILRRPADGLAYALSIADRHHVTYEQILERVKP
jgi:hypothetical protein